MYQLLSCFFSLVGDQTQASVNSYSAKWPKPPRMISSSTNYRAIFQPFSSYLGQQCRIVFTLQLYLGERVEEDHASFELISLFCNKHYKYCWTLRFYVSLICLWILVFFISPDLSCEGRFFIILVWRCAHVV